MSHPQPRTSIIDVTPPEELDPNPELIQNVQFHGRWSLDGERRYTTYWCGSSVFFQTTSKLVTIEIGSLTKSRKNYHNVMWKFGSASVVRTALVNRRRSLKITPSDGRGGEALRDVEVMLCGWGATLQILDIRASDERSINLPIINQPIRPFLFIGGSLVSGFSPDFQGLVLPHGTYQTFGAAVVRNFRNRGLGAHLEMVAFPGMRLMTTEHGFGMEDVFFDGWNGGGGGWDDRPKNDVPHDVFICIGADDQRWGADANEFVGHFSRFLERMRDNYGAGLTRVHVISPFGRFPNHNDHLERITVFEPEVQTMVKTLSVAWKNDSPDGARLYHISTAGWLDKTLTCDGLHPTAEGHDIIANKLIEYLDMLDKKEGIVGATAPPPQNPPSAGIPAITA